MWREMLVGWKDVNQILTRFVGKCTLVAFVAIAVYSIQMESVRYVKLVFAGGQQNLP